MIDPEIAAQRLQTFVHGYAEQEPEHQQHIDLKLDHSLRVWREAQRIVAGEKIDAFPGTLAEVAAIYHDVGRFPQYRRYRTFKDGVSVNHGHLGFKVLRREGLLQGIADPARKVILQCVFMHNRARLPAGLPEPVRTGLWIVRDADKVDIVRVMAGHMLDTQADDGGVLTLGLRDDPERYTPSLLAHVRSRSLVDYRSMVWVNDFKLLLCSWVFALNFATSRRVLAERGQIQRLLESLPRDKETAAMSQDVIQALGAG